MTVRSSKGSQDLNNTGSCGYQRFREMKKLISQEVDWCWNGKSTMMIFTKLGRDQDSSRCSSEEDVESLVSDEKEDVEWTKSAGFVHHQILKIRDEDSRIGEDFGECLIAKTAFLRLALEMDAVFLSRPILPSSPLSGKTVINQFTNAI